MDYILPSHLNCCLKADLVNAVKNAGMLSLFFLKHILNCSPFDWFICYWNWNVTDSAFISNWEGFNLLGPNSSLCILWWSRAWFVCSKVICSRLSSWSEVIFTGMENTDFVVFINSDQVTVLKAKFDSSYKIGSLKIITQSASY